MVKMKKKKIKDFQDLEIYQIALDLTKKIYKLVDSFPAKEKFILSNQLLRAVLSIGANIAEGSGRFYRKEFIKFLYIARGSLMEVYHFIILAKELNYLKKKEYLPLENDINKLSVKINNLISSISKHNK